MMKQSDWADFPRENVLYQLDVVFKNENAESEDKQYSIVHYAAFFFLKIIIGLMPTRLSIL